MEITEEHLEWATVHRMRDMLADVNEDYKVTSTYALFTAILCWVMQRVRAPGNGPIDTRARVLYEELKQEKAGSAPWNFTSAGDRPHLSGFEFTAHSDVQNINDLTAADLLISLRNAVAHGDGRTILPVNHSQYLVGQKFLVRARQGENTLWTGKIELRRPDMTRIAELLAGRFCIALEAQRNNDPDFMCGAEAINEGANDQ